MPPIEVLGRWVNAAPIESAGLAVERYPFWSTHMIRARFADELERRTRLANARSRAELAGYAGRMSFHYYDLSGRKGYLVEVRIEA